MKNHRLGVLLAASIAGASLITVVHGDDAAAAPAEQAVASEFVGNWKVQDGKGRAFYIVLNEDGSAASKWADAAEQRRNESGTWTLVDGGAVILWANGWHEVISKSGDGYVKKAYAAKLALDGKPSNESSASKVDALPTP